MFAARAFCSTRRSVGLLSGLGPPAFTAMAMSLPMRVNALAILSHRLNMVALRVSKMRPMTNGLPRETRVVHRSVSGPGGAATRYFAAPPPREPQVNVEPRSGSLSAEMLPPMASTTCRTIHRPSPRPP